MLSATSVPFMTRRVIGTKITWKQHIQIIFQKFIFQIKLAHILLQEISPIIPICDMEIALTHEYISSMPKFLSILYSCHLLKFPLA